MQLGSCIWFHVDCPRSSNTLSKRETLQRLCNNLLPRCMRKGKVGPCKRIRTWKSRLGTCSSLSSSRGRWAAQSSMPASCMQWRCVCETRAWRRLFWFGRAQERFYCGSGRRTRFFWAAYKPRWFQCLASLLWPRPTGSPFAWSVLAGYDFLLTLLKQVCGDWTGIATLQEKVAWPMMWLWWVGWARESGRSPCVFGLFCGNRAFWGLGLCIHKRSEESFVCCRKATPWFWSGAWVL